MSKSSAAISLVLFGTASAAFVSYKAVNGSHRPPGEVQPTGFNQGGSDFVQGDGSGDGGGDGQGNNLQGNNPYDGSTRPSTNPADPNRLNNGSSGSRSTYHSNTYHPYSHTGSSGYGGWHSSSGGFYSGSSSGSSGSSGGAPARSAGTSRGGFGSTGHATASASG